MNFLAHLFLTRQHNMLTVGNYLGDFLTNRQVSALPDEVRMGVVLHRKIDEYTDQHPEVKKAVNLLKNAHGRYAAVVLDVVFDHLLAGNWELFSDAQSLREFADQTYAVLLDATPLMPPAIAERTRKMVEADWLVQYATVDGINHTFSKMMERSSQPNCIANGAISMELLKDKINERFLLFFPDIIKFVQEEMKHV